MQVIYKDTVQEILRLRKNETFTESFSSYIRIHNIPSATFTLIGAASSVLLSFYDLSVKKYETTLFEEELEITSVIGNVSFIDEKVKIHAHGTFSKRDFSVIGGHIDEITISATGEIHLQKLPKKTIRTFDEETGLYLLRE